MQRPPAQRAALAVQLRCWLGCSAQLCCSQAPALRSVSGVSRSPRTARGSSDAEAVADVWLPEAAHPAASSMSAHAMGVKNRIEGV